MSINTTFLDFSRWRPSAILDFQKFEISTAGVVRGANMRQPNALLIGQTVVEISRFLIFQDVCRRHLGFFKFQICNGQEVELRHRAKFR